MADSKDLNTLDSMPRFSPSWGTPNGSVGQTHGGTAYDKQVYPLNETYISPQDRLHQMDAYKALDSARAFSDYLASRHLDPNNLTPQQLQNNQQRFNVQQPSWSEPQGTDKQRLGHLYYDDAPQRDLDHGPNNSLRDAVTQYNGMLPGKPQQREWDNPDPTADPNEPIGNESASVKQRDLADVITDPSVQNNATAQTMNDLIPKVASKTATKDEYMQFYNLMGQDL